MPVRRIAVRRRPSNPSLQHSWRRAGVGLTATVLFAALAAAPAVANGTGGATPGRSATAAPADATLPPGTLFLQRYAATNMAAGDQKVTASQANDIASRFNVVVAAKRTFAAYAAAMHAVNPSLRLLVYGNGAFTGMATGYPEEWYARDANGAKVRSTNFGNYLMNVGNPAWGTSVGQACALDLSNNGYDGCYLDMLGTAPLGAGYVTGLPINPATGAVWTPADYMAATRGILAEVKNQNPNVLVTGNGLGAGGRYWKSAEAGSSLGLLLSLDAAHSEIWLRKPTQSMTSFKPEKSWLQDVNMVADAGARGRVVLATTKIWTSASQAQTDAWHRYTVASFLLATDGRSYLNFLPTKTMAGITQDHPYDRVDVGVPTGALAPAVPLVKKDGVYQREFTKGLAVVNPTTATVTVPLAQPMTTLDGVTVTSITMAPNTGEVLTHS